MEPRLDDVFGIRVGIPTHTYVDRQGLDQLFGYYVTSHKHVMIHGDSKQGKTVLRERVLPNDMCIRIPCHSGSTVASIYTEICRQLNLTFPCGITQSTTDKVEGRVIGKVKAGIPSILGGTVGSELAGGQDVETVFNYLPVRLGPENLHVVIDAIRTSRKRLVIDDFHYLPEDEKKAFSLDLKAMYDQGVFVVLVGIWPEQNLIVHYNRDLDGRVEDVNVQWSDEELQTVLKRGEEALNIDINDLIEANMVYASDKNVGLIQRLAESFCLYSQVHGRQEQATALGDRVAFDKAVAKVASDMTVGYRQWAENFARGFKAEAKLRVYENILRAVAASSREDLMHGLHRAELLRRVNQMNPDIRHTDLVQALVRINRLQVSDGSSRPVLAYNKETETLQVVDRGVVFHREYGPDIWPWSSSE